MGAGNIMGFSRKLPIAETAVDSVLFGFKSIFTALRLGWFSFVLWGAGIVLGGYVMVQAMPGLVEMFRELMFLAQSSDGLLSASDEATIEALLVEMFADTKAAPLLVGGLILLAANAFWIPTYRILAQIAAGDIAPPSGFMYWRWGAREWRVLGTIISYYVMFILLAIGVDLISTPLATNMAATDTLSKFVWVVPLLELWLVMWLLVRTIFLIPASAIEQDFSIGMVLKATAGNSFRILGSLIVFILLIVLTLIGLWIVFFVTSLLFSTLYTMTVLGSSEGNIWGLIVQAVSIVFMILFMAMPKLANLAWSAKAWAAMRPDGVGACGIDGPKDGEVCAV